MIRIKFWLILFLTRVRLKWQRLINRCPRRLRVFGGPLLGASIGLIGGIPGFLIGLLLGYLLGELVVQSRRDRKIFDYFENPGPQQFYEGEGGLAAWCALGVLIAADVSTDMSAASPLSPEKIIKQVTLGACYVFTGALADPSLMEHFSRLAFSKRSSLNPDLLAESLAARSRLDKGNLVRALSALAEGEKAKSLVREIRLILNPGMDDDELRDSDPENQTATSTAIPKDPWRILGLPPGTPLKEVKFHYRRLAKQFHPDELQILDEKRQIAAAQAFITIKEAYKQISGENSGG